MAVGSPETLNILASVVFREYSFLELNVVCGFDEKLVNGALVLEDYEYSFTKGLFSDKTLWPSYNERTLFIPVIYNLGWNVDKDELMVKSITPLSVYVQDGFKLRRLESALELKIMDYVFEKFKLLVDNVIYFNALKRRNPSVFEDKTIIKNRIK